MKKIVILLIFLAPSISLFAQNNNVGIGTNTPDPSAILELSSSNQGLRLTRVPTTASISNPVNGLLIFSESDQKLYYYNGTTWKELIHTEVDPKINATTTNRVPRWNGTVLVDGTIRDDDTNVGIGTAPVANQKLTVSGKTTTDNLQMTTGATNGFVLQSDVTGNATWVNANTLGTLNLYNSNGSLTSHRTLTQGNFDLTFANNGTQNTIFNLTSTGDFDIQKNGVGAFFVSDNGRIGVNTSSPLAHLHVKDSSVVFTGLSTLPTVPGNPPVSGAGTRMMWYPDKGAFRAGTISSDHWDKDNVGVNSVAFGFNSTASGKRSVAIGFLANAMGTEAISMGFNSVASGTNSVALGAANIASGKYSIALGLGTKASGVSSTAMGENTESSGSHSTSMGLNSVARAYGSLVIGRNNDSITNSSAISWIATDPVFIIGNGTSETNRKNAMTVYKNGTLKLENLTSTPANHSDKFYVLNNEPYYGNTKMQSSQLENITEGGNTGWRLLGRNPGNYGNIGEDAVDLSENINVSATTGATGDNSLASGSQTTAFGFYSTAMGFRTTALGPAATAMGWETTASGNYSTAMGQSTEASSWNSTSMGQSTEASGVSSTSMGFQTLARAYASLSLGRYNDSIAGSNPTTWVEADPLFIIGNGTSTNNRKNAVTILKNAKTGINTSTPEAGLHIKGIDASWNSHIRLETAGGGDYGNILYDGNMKFRNFGAGDEYQWRNSAGNTRMTLFDNGDLTIAGTLTTGSDARLKKDIKPIHNALAIISGINGYTYQWVDESRGSLLQSGVIAQEIEASLPHLVRTDEDDEKSVNYIGMVPYLIEAVKDLKKENEELKKLVEKLLGDSK